jgi:glycosyltransferase involved in cell wall biosynthesis
MLSMAAIQVRLIEARVRPDLLHAQSATPLAIAARWSRTPMVLTVHGLEAYAGRGARKRMARLVLDLSLQRANGVIVISPYVEWSLGRRLVGKLTTTIDNAVARTYFEVAAGPVEKIVLCVGNISELKNQALLIRAFAQVSQKQPGWRLALAGPIADQTYFRRCEATIRELDLSNEVTLVGEVKASALPEWYRRADVVALASVQETSPLAVSQAMAAGRAVVATDVGGIRWMVQDGVTGVVVQPDDYIAMAKALQTLLSDAGLREAMGAKGRCAAHERYQPTNVAAKTVDFYQRVASLGA